MKPSVRRTSGGLAISLCKRIEKIAAEKEMSFEETVNFLVQEAVMPARQERIFFTQEVVTPIRCTSILK